MNYYYEPMSYYYGTLRIKEFGKNAASRKARKKGNIKKAEEIEARVLKEHQSIINEGFIWASGCGRFRTSICTCSACRKQKGG